MSPSSFVQSLDWHCQSMSSGGLIKRLTKWHLNSLGYCLVLRNLHYISLWSLFSVYTTTVNGEEIWILHLSTLCIGSYAVCFLYIANPCLTRQCRDRRLPRQKCNATEYSYSASSRFQRRSRRWVTWCSMSIWVNMFNQFAKPSTVSRKSYKWQAISGYLLLMRVNGGKVS